MAVGNLKHIDNIDAKFGADPWYWFVKVQAKGRGEAGEEYWLVTEEEALKFAERAEKNPEDDPGRRKGVFDRVANTEAKFDANAEYLALKVRTADKSKVGWMLTESDLERLRERAEKNAEDIEANKESWLADLLD